MARKEAKPKSSSLTPFYGALALVAVLGIGLIAYQLFARGGSAATEPVDVDIDPSELSSVRGIEIGDPNAPVVMYEFADFQCPACAQYANLYAPMVKERLVETGLVRYVHYDYPLIQIHPHAFLAARAGRCANEQGKFWEWHDIVYARQVRWTAMSDASDVFIDIGEEVGMDRGEFEACVRSDRFADEVTRSMRLGDSMGVPGTPTIFVNMRRLQQIPSIEQLEAMVREEAGMAGDTAAAQEAA